MKKLTKSQRALIQLLRCNMGDHAIAAMGEAHPTVKWFRRVTGSKSHNHEVLARQIDRFISEQPWIKKRKGIAY